MAKSQVASVQKQIETEVQEIQKLQRELAKLYDGRRKYHEKKAENEAVLREFGFLDAGSAVYKLVGPVLAKQDISEAKQTVEKRLAYINKEMYYCFDKVINRIN